MPNRKIDAADGLIAGAATIHVRLPMKGYRGTNDAILRKIIRRNQLKDEIENYLNAQINSCPDEIQQFMYYEIARDLGAKVEEIREILSCRGGYNGVTLRKQPDSLTE